ncbi:MAG TPA: hypothetical protein VFS20_01430, partial [Longimicrobium sp.]|nr:hypothetical protein [Longimicrobium sp.]
MDITPELIGLTAVIFGGLAFLIPVAGVTARIALKPIVEAMARYRELKGNDESTVLLERRMALMEEHINSIGRSVQVLVEDADFRRRLEANAPVQAASLPRGD